PERAERWISRPPGNRRPALNEERREQDYQAHKRDPEREHVQDRECHIARAELNRQDVIPEAGERHGGQEEENHDRAVEREQRKIKFGRHHAAGKARWKQMGEERRRRIRPRQTHAHHHRKRGAQDGGEQAEQYVLNADDLVVRAENVLTDEAGGLGVDGSVLHYWALLAFSHALKSASDNTRNRARILKCCMPHSSAQATSYSPIFVAVK